MNTIEGNKLIAEFLFPNWQEEFNNDNIIIEKGIMVKAILYSKDYEQLRYHSSWDWLMPVVEKIWDKTTKGEFPFETNREYSFLLLPIYTNIDEVWLSVVEFLQWLNKQ